jgi:CheY-like chemotaxis protein
VAPTWHADDNQHAAESLAMLLRMEGHDVTVVHNGKEALAAFSAVQPEVAILDIGMPELNGYEVARQVRQGSLGRAVTLIAVRGWAQDRDKARAQVLPTKAKGPQMRPLPL